MVSIQFTAESMEVGSVPEQAALQPFLSLRWRPRSIRSRPAQPRTHVGYRCRPAFIRRPPRRIKRRQHCWSFTDLVCVQPVIDLGSLGYWQSFDLLDHIVRRHGRTLRQPSRLPSGLWPHVPAP